MINLLKKEKTKATLSVVLLAIGIILLTLTPTPLFNLLSYTLNGAVVGMLATILGFIIFLDTL